MEGWAYHIEVRQMNMPSITYPSFQYCRSSYMLGFCWIVVSSESGLIIILLENNCIPVNRLNIVTYPKAMPINEHIMPMRISMATMSLPPNSFDFYYIRQNYF